MSSKIVRIRSFLQLFTLKEGSVARRAKRTSYIQTIQRRGGRPIRLDKTYKSLTMVLMEQIRVWEVGFSAASTELFDDLDVAVEYMKAELRREKTGAWLESRFMDAGDYQREIDRREQEWQIRR